MNHCYKVHCCYNLAAAVGLQTRVTVACTLTIIFLSLIVDVFGSITYVRRRGKVPHVKSVNSQYSVQVGQQVPSYTPENKTR